MPDTRCFDHDPGVYPTVGYLVRYTQLRVKSMMSGVAKLSTQVAIPASRNARVGG